MSSKPEIVPFAHGAAGHQGISTSADGSLLIKPCTKAEIDFYESASAHPEFQAHMPVYMGSLRAGDSEIQKHAGKLQADQSGQAAASSTASHRRAASGHIVSEPKIARSATKEWTPSGGAKLTSDLSIVLSNATAGFQKPNVIDLKLGARLWDDDAPQAKRTKLDDVANTSTSGSLGFRVAGMKVYIGDSDKVERDVNTTVEGGYKVFDKFYGRSNINDDNIQSAFEAFLSSLALSESTSPEERRKGALRRLLVLERLTKEISSMQFALENEESRMYSASVLMVYEGDSKALDTVIEYDDKLQSAKAIESDDREDEDEDAEDEDDEVKQKIHEAVMIDFAHAHWTPGQGPDENALKGVRSINQILTKMLEEAQKLVQKQG